MEKQYSGSCNDAIITAYVPVYSAALLSLLPTLSGRKQLFVSNIIEEFYKLKYCSTVVYMVSRA